MNADGYGWVFMGVTEYNSTSAERNKGGKNEQRHETERKRVRSNRYNKPIFRAKKKNQTRKEQKKPRQKPNKKVK